METQLAFDGQERQLGLRFREKLVTDLGIVCKVCAGPRSRPQAPTQGLRDRLSAPAGQGPAQHRHRCAHVRSAPARRTPQPSAQPCARPAGGVDWDTNLWMPFHPFSKPPPAHSRYAAPRQGQPAPLALLLGGSYHRAQDEVIPWLKAKQHLRTPGNWRLKLRGTLQYPLKAQEVRTRRLPACCLPVRGAQAAS